MQTCMYVDITYISMSDMYIYAHTYTHVWPCMSAYIQINVCLCIHTDK